MGNRSDSDKKSLFDEMRDEFQEGREKTERKLKQQANEDPQDIDQEFVSEAVDKIVRDAKSDTVTTERLLGQEQYFTNVLPFLEKNEQPHFLFPLTQGLLAEPALVVETGPEQKELLSKTDGGTVVISNRYIRIHSSKGEWTIPYNSVASVDFVGHPALHIQTSGRTYYIHIAGTHFDEEENLSEAVNYIREMQRNSRENPQSTSESDPIDQLERLSELKDKGVVSEEEFQTKKQEILDKI